MALATAAPGLSALGAGLTAAEAFRRARTELAERRAGLFPRAEPLLRASRRELGDSAIPPEALLLYSARQYRRRGAPQRLGRDTPIHWAPCWDVIAGRERWVPAALVYYRFPESRFGRADSNGVAAGNRLGSAALAGLLELIERDSVALWWYNRARRPRIALASDPWCRRVLDWYQAQGRDCWALDLRSDLGVPVVAAVSRRRSGPERLLLGFGAGATCRHAAVHALRELTQLLAVAEAASRREVVPAAATRHWLAKATLAPHRQLRPGPGVTRLPTTPRRAPPSLHQLSARLGRQGIPVLFTELSRPSAALRVVRVMAPGLRPWWPRFAPGRLYHAPVAAGWRSRPLPESRLNSFGFFM